MASCQINIDLDIENLILQVKKNITDFLREEHENEQDRLVARRIAQYISSSAGGNLQDRYLLKEFLKTFLLQTGITIYEIDETGKITDEAEAYEVKITKDNVDKIIPFLEKDSLSIQEKFEIILLKLNSQKEIKHKKENGFKNLMKKYPYYMKNDGNSEVESYSYQYNEDDIHYVFELEEVQLTYEEKIEIIIQRIYEEAYGLKQIDMLNCNLGDEVGVSQNGNYVYFWSDYKIWLSFIKISVGELKQIQERSKDFDKSIGQLDEGNPEIVCHRADGARVTLTQPPYFSSRNICIRFFDAENEDYNDLIPDYKVQLLSKVLIESGESISYQGPLGSGKTTTMKATIKGLLGIQNHLGTIEEHFEQHNMDANPNMRVVEAQRVIGKNKQEDIKSLSDALKTLLRMSVDVVNLGEARDGESLYVFMQMQQAIGKSSYFTAQVSTPEDTISRYKNMLMATGVYTNEQAAVMDIVNCINVIYQHDIRNSKRGIYDIVEIIPLVEKHCEIDYGMDSDLETLEKMALIQQIQQNPYNLYRLNYLLTVGDDGTSKFVNYPSKNMIKRAYKTKAGTYFMNKLLSEIEKDLDYPYKEK